MKLATELRRALIAHCVRRLASIDLFLPMHLNFKFFGMTPLKTFVCYDVTKNPDIENDFVKYAAHLSELFPPASVTA